MCATKCGRNADCPSGETLTLALALALTLTLTLTPTHFRVQGYSLGFIVRRSGLGFRL